MVVFFSEHRSVFSEKLLWEISDFTPLGGKKKGSFNFTIKPHSLVAKIKNFL